MYGEKSYVVFRTFVGMDPTTDAGRGEKRLSRGRIQAIFTSVGRPLGECRLQPLTQMLSPTKRSRMSKYLLTVLAATGAGFAVYFSFDSQLPVSLVFFAIFLYAFTLLVWKFYTSQIPNKIIKSILEAWRDRWN